MRLYQVAACALLVAACDAKGSIARPENSNDTQSSSTNGSAAGNDPSSQGPQAGDAGVSQTGDLLRSSQPALQWKRYAAFENDLAAALALPKDALCKELGGTNCIRGVHLSPLGGHDPFTSGLIESSAEPLATTPSVVERIVLSACVARAELELSGKEQPQVFTGLDLKGQAPAPEDAVTTKVVTNLYRRFLARDPDAQETEIVASLTRDAQGKAISALTFAKTACFTVGTVSEFLFF